MQSALRPSPPIGFDGQTLLGKFHETRDKVLVFSWSTAMLDVLEVCRDVPVVYLDVTEVIRCCCCRVGPSPFPSLPPRSHSVCVSRFLGHEHDMCCSVCTLFFSTNTIVALRWSKTGQIPQVIVSLFGALQWLW